jgi:alcohol dehydrogenase class IV
MSFKDGDADLLAFQDWTFPVPIAYGPNRLSEIGQRCAALGLHNPLIVTDRGSRTLPFIGELQQHLAGAGLKCAVFADISPNPRDDEIGAGRKAWPRWQARRHHRYWWRQRHGRRQGDLPDGQQ